MSSIPQIGEMAPDFTLPTDGGGSVTLSELRGQNVVVYFYPKDDTPGCTKEAIAFTEHLDAFKAANTVIIGVSKDTVAKHEKFKAKHNLGVILGSDEDGAMIETYGVWIEKNMYGKKYMGIQRATFLIGEDGTVQASWPKVRVPGHVEAVLDAAQTL